MSRKPVPYAESESRPSFSIPMISVTHAENEDDDYPLSQQSPKQPKSKATEAREAVESVQTVLEENIAGIDECECGVVDGRGGGQAPEVNELWFMGQRRGLLAVESLASGINEGGSNLDSRWHD